jgi:hypothetical protein
LLFSVEHGVCCGHPVTSLSKCTPRRSNATPNNPNLDASDEFAMNSDGDCPKEFPVEHDGLCYS